MKIAISGASSTGKTTLAEALSKSNFMKEKGISFIKSREREILFEMGYQSMDKMSLWEQLEFQNKFFEWKLSLESQSDDYITDCSFVDVASYYKLRENGIKQKNVEAKCKQMALKYDFHIFLPIGLIKFQKDGFRSVETELHETIHNQILTYYNEWGIKYYTVATNVLEERIYSSLNFVNGNGQ